MAIDADFARHHLRAGGQEDRIEEIQEDARAVGVDDVRNADRDAVGLREVLEPQRAEVELDLAEQLDERHELLEQAVEHGVDEARHHLAVTEPEAPDEELELRHPAPPGPAGERIVRVLGHRNDLEAPDPSVGADAHPEAQGREVLVVAEQVAQRLEWLPVAELPGIGGEVRQARAGTGEAFRHGVDDFLVGLQYVELAPVRVPFARSCDALDLTAKSAQGRVEALQPVAERRHRDELRQHQAAVLHEYRIGGRVREQLEQIVGRDDRTFGSDPDLHAKRDEALEEEVVLERRRIPGGGIHGRSIEGLAEEAPGGAAGKRDCQPDLRALAIDAQDRDRMEQIRYRRDRRPRRERNSGRRISKGVRGTHHCVHSHCEPPGRRARWPRTFVL